MASVATSLIKTATSSTSTARKLLLGQVHPTYVPKAKKIVVKHMDFDEWLKMVKSLLNFKLMQLQVIVLYSYLTIRNVCAVFSEERGLHST